MFRRIFFTAIVAGLLGGLVISVVQEFTTTPIILHAEEFENKGGEAGHKHGRLDRDLALISPAHAHGHETAATNTSEQSWGPAGGLERSLFTTLANVLTGIGFALILTASFAIAGHPMSGRTGVLWGLAGFGVISLAPALGLSAQVPKPESVLGIGGAVPPELAGHFAAASLVTAAIFWCILGWLSGTFWQRFATKS